MSDLSKEHEGKTKFCKHCGEKIAYDAVICVKCGRQVEDVKNTKDPQNIVINNANNNSQAQNVVGGGYGRPKDKVVAILLCLFLGYLGGHKFYEGKIGMGLLYLCTCGLVGIGVLIDLIALIGKPNPYYV